MTEFLIAQTLNSLVYSMLLFLLALGLSLTFGLMRIVNLAHGAFFLLGTYLGLSIWNHAHSFLLAVVLVPVATGLIGALLEKTWLERFYARAELDQVILTFGFALVFADVMKMVWGGDIRGVQPPALLRGAISIGAVSFPSYRLVLIAVGVALFVATWLAIERTRIGALVRASVSDRAMVAGLGFNVRFLFTVIFGFGCGLAGLCRLARRSDHRCLSGSRLRSVDNHAHRRSRRRSGKYHGRLLGELADRLFRDLRQSSAAAIRQFHHLRRHGGGVADPLVGP